MLRRHIILLIAICPSDGDIKPGGPLGAFQEEQAMSRHRVSPSLFLSSSSSLTTQSHYTNSYPYSHSNLNFLQHYTDTLPIHNVVCPSGAWFENRPHSTPSIRLVWNPKRVIVQWVCIGTHTHTHSPFLNRPHHVISYSHSLLSCHQSSHLWLGQIFGLYQCVIMPVGGWRSGACTM